MILRIKVVKGGWKKSLLVCYSVFLFKNDCVTIESGYKNTPLFSAFLREYERFIFCWNMMKNVAYQI